MKKHLSKRIPQAVLSFCIIITALCFFEIYSKKVSSEKFGKNIEPKTAGIIQSSRNQPAFSAPVASTAIEYAESLPVRELAKKSLNLRKAPAKQYSETLPENLNRYSAPSDSSQNETESTKSLLRKFNSLEPQSPDETLPRNNPTSSIVPQVLPTPTVSFEGISIFDTSDLDQGFLPPDPMGEAGPNHYVQVVNVAFKVWDKSGTPLTPTILLRSLFAPLVAPCYQFIGHAGVTYDQLADRWIITQRCDKLAPGRQFVAVSKTNDPTGAYYLYSFQMTNTKHIDQPKFGVWSDGYYMADTQIDKRGIFFRGAGFFAFDRAKMLKGDPTASFIYFDSCPGNINCVVAGALPSDIDGFIPPPPGAPNVFALYTANEWGDPQGDGLRLFDFHADFTTPANSTFTERVGSPLAVAAFDPMANFVKQPVPASSSSYLKPLTDRLMHRLAYRNFGTGVESLIITHTVDTPTQDHVGVRYYQLNRTAPASPFTIAEQQTFSPDSTSRFMSSGAMNFQGDTVIGFSASSETVFPSIRYAARLGTDPPGTGLAQGEQTIIAGTGSQLSSTGNWGYTSDLTVEPNDDCSFWYTQEYYEFTGSGPWQTRIAKFAPRECVVSPRGSVQGTVTSCATNQPLPDVTIDLDGTGAFNRRTDVTGTYAMTVAPGTYTIIPKKLGYYAAPISGVTVDDGNAAVRDFCMMPVPSLSPSAAPTVTSGNNLIEPNECNTLNIPITNNGTVPASAVSATVSTNTPGVTLVSPTSAYPDIAPNGGVQTNITPFRISTDSSLVCLTSIDLTVTVTYSGGNKSPAVFNLKMTVGQPRGPNYGFTVSTGEITTGGVLVPGSQDNLMSEIPTPFAFTLYGKPVNAGQLLGVHRFGVIELNDNDANPFPINEPLPTSTVESTTAVLFPYWDDLTMRPDSITGSGVFTLTSGTAPNRSFQIEWRARTGSMFGPVDTVFAVVLHENSDDFEYIYSLTGSNPGNWSGLSATIGVQGMSWGTNFTQFSYLLQSVLPGTKISFSRPAAVCSQGSGTCPNLTTKRAPYDFDGDNKTDVGIFRSADGSWWYNRSSTNDVRVYTFGTSSDIITPGDYSGDGKADVAVFRPSTGFWYIQRSEDNSFFSFPFGAAGDVPAPADYDSDGKTDAAVYRPSSGTWYVLNSGGSGTGIVNFGTTEDKPVAADYDGDGKADIAIFRPSDGSWWYLQSSNAQFKVYRFGVASDKPVQGDFTGDGRADIAIFRPSTGEWFVQRSEDGSFYSVPFGTSGDLPAPGDYDGDGKFDTAVFRPAGGTWYAQRSTAGLMIQQFGSSGDRPIPNSFVP